MGARASGLAEHRREQIVSALRAYEREHETPPSVNMWRRARLTPVAKVIYRRFVS